MDSALRKSFKAHSRSDQLLTRNRSKVYKSYVSKWRLDKKNKKREMEAIVRKRQKRLEAGKSSEFRIRGKVIGPCELSRYLERARLSVAEIIAQRSSIATPPSVECWTPLRSPSPMTAPRITCTSVPPSMTTPEVLQRPEMIVRCIRNYTRGTFDTGTWRADNFGGIINVNHGPGIVTQVNAMAIDLSAAVNLFDLGSPEQAGKLLLRSTTDLRDILAADCHNALNLLFGMIIMLLARGRPEIALAILKHCSAMTEILLPQRHPLVQVFNHLVMLGTDQLEQAISVCYKSIAGSLEEIIGSENLTTLACRVYSIINTCKRLEYNDPGFGLLPLLQGVESPSGPDLRLRTIRDRLYLAWSLYSKGDYHTAMTTVNHPVFMETSMRCLKVYSLNFIALCQRRLGQDELAEANMREGVVLAATQYGVQHSQAIGLLVDLERFLLKWGKLDAAAQVRKERSEAVNAIS